MIEGKYFFDTYALIEIFKGNENYRKFASSATVTAYLNLLELYYNLAKSYDQQTVSAFLERLRDFCTDLKFEWIADASTTKMKNRELSYADCLGYVAAKRLGIKFLTGDSQFKNMPNVEFVK